jgi:PAS domain-containing protein
MRQWELRGITLDIADRRPGPEAVEAPDAPIRILVDQMPAVFWTTDEALRFTSSLGAGLAALGLGPNQLVGTTLGDFLEGDLQAPAVEAHRQALQGDTIDFVIGWGVSPMRCRVGPLHDSIGTCIGTICVAMGQSSTAPEEQPTAIPA